MSCPPFPAPSVLAPLLVAGLLVSACTTEATPPPRPAVAPPRAVAEPVMAAPAPAPLARQAAGQAPAYRGDWRDWPLTPGDWVYRQDARGSIALFGPRGADAELTVRCDRIAATIFVSRRGAAPGNAPMTVRTSSLLRGVTTQPTGAEPAYMAASLNPRDPLLDAIGFSRGRFVIEQATLPTLVVPAWPEVLRVAEDCRR